jgi:hypothetical protein
MLAHYVHEGFAPTAAKQSLTRDLSFARVANTARPREDWQPPGKPVEP